MLDSWFIVFRLDKIEMENLTNEVLQAANKKETIGEYFTDDDSKIDKESTSGTAVAKITKVKAHSYHIPITLKSCLGKNLVIDPVSEEESYQDGSLMITCMPSRNEVTQLFITGEWSTPKTNEAMELCLGACSKLCEVMRSCLKDAVTDSKE